MTAKSPAIYLLTIHGSAEKMKEITRYRYYRLKRRDAPLHIERTGEGIKYYIRDQSKNIAGMRTVATACMRIARREEFRLHAEKRRLRSKNAGERDKKALRRASGQTAGIKRQWEKQVLLVRGLEKLQAEYDRTKAMPRTGPPGLPELVSYCGTASREMG